MTRASKLACFHAKAVFVGTGEMRRLFPGVTPALMNNDTLPITLTGDGRAMAYRLGAELTNMEMLYRHVGLRNFARQGQGSWIGVYRDPQDRPIGPYVTEPDRLHGDKTPEVDKELFGRIFETARGPVYMDCRGISDGDLAFLEQSLGNEGNQAVVDHLHGEGVDLRQNAVEFATYSLIAVGGIYRNDKAETSVPGLYSAGDEWGNGISAAAIFGWIAGENAARHARQAPAPDGAGDQARIDETARLIGGLSDGAGTRGHDWKDANIALQQTMRDYAGITRSAAMLGAGLDHLGRLKDKLREGLCAENQLEVVRCLEVLNLYDMGELLIQSALDRTESRDLHRRVDCPLTDPLLNGQAHISRREAGRPAFGWKGLA
jgi:succinate dehydrogenase/fumarate reductase flavoprotein subunit